MLFGWVEWVFVAADAVGVVHVVAQGCFEVVVCERRAVLRSSCMRV